ncbi:MAG: hypothetical protein D6681_19850 [Calditrichaeota bacterium]|nr:MAG: hypothetical protein D6681_19850 [Calditrichota bacterium]
MKDTLSRKEFLKQLSLICLGVVGAGSLFSGCGSDKGEQAGTQGGEAPEASAPQADPCADLTGLSETDINIRKNFQYVGKSEKPDQYCNNCQFWIPPEGDQFCGGCQIIKGPINPKGWCQQWVARQS